MLGGLVRPETAGGEEEKTGLSVRRLWIRGLRWVRVPTPVVRVGGAERFPESAASVGVVRSADEVGGRIDRTLRTSSKLWRWMSLSSGAGWERSSRAKDSGVGIGVPNSVSTTSDTGLFSPRPETFGALQISSARWRIVARPWVVRRSFFTIGYSCSMFRNT